MNSQSQKVSFKTEDDITIVGVLSLPNKKKPPVILMAHGFCADKSENGFFQHASQIFTRNGCAVLRFDFRGCGESDGQFINVRLFDKTRDVKSAINFLKNCDLKLDKENIGYVGFSLGATIGLLAESNDIKVSAFWSPAFFPCDDMYPRYCTEEIKSELKNYGYFTKEKLKVGTAFLEDLSKCNTKELLKRYDKPSIVIHGKNDKRISYLSTKKGFESLSCHKLINLIEGASHSFRESKKLRNDVAKLTAIWFNYYFAKKK
tara:strand:- start:432 stop:1214 length:783 start_codon:yes stop_codon:yes gene_type:complete